MSAIPELGSSRRRGAFALLLALAGAAFLASMGLGACSLILSGDANQCSSDADCARFPGSVCGADNTCVTRASSSSAGGGACAGGGGCYACKPTTNEEIVTACTNAQCAAFDKKRLTKLTADGGLPPTP